MAHYPSTAFIPLEYHYSGNVPISNPADSTMNRWYAWWGKPATSPKETWDGVIPHAQVRENETEFDWGNWIDGHATKGCTAFGCGPDQVTNMETVVNAELRKAPEAVLHLEATPRNGTIVTKVQVTSISKSHSDVYLRIVVIEDTVLLKAGDTAEFN
jgi:hypothetical protein